MVQRPLAAVSADSERTLRAAAVDLSIVIPIYNEEPNIAALHGRLAPVLDELGRTVEVWYVDDGSTDRSLALMRDIAAADARVGVIELSCNVGQHAAVLAGFAASRGATVITLDGDLQNPPEEIPRLLEQIDAGNEVVGTWRENRDDRQQAGSQQRPAPRRRPACLRYGRHADGR